MTIAHQKQGLNKRCAVRTLRNMKILLVLSHLLNYPSQELQDAKDELIAVITAAKEIPPSSREQLSALVKELCESDLLTVQDKYDALFEQGRSLSLLMFEHVHGDSRDRGQAMVDLMAHYNEKGFHINVKELPDYIPLYLEFLAHGDPMDARVGLAEVGHILALLSARLQERDANYHAIFDALMIVGGVSAKDINFKELKAKVAAEERDDTPEAFDKVWEEEQVTFMANQNPTAKSACSTTSDIPFKPKEEQAQPMHWVGKK